VDFDEAVRDALAVYYFPGMWDWSRTIVRPLATEAFLKSMRKQRDAYLGPGPLSPDQEAAWEESVAACRTMLEGYYEWAAEVDKFSAVQVETLFDVTVPDPDELDLGLLTHEGRGINYRLRVDMVVVDEHELYWLVDHRIVTGRFRRTQIPRGRSEIEGAGQRVATEVRDMTRAGIPCYPTPASDGCEACRYRSPCIALMQGEDPRRMLELGFRPRTAPDFEEGRLGSVWCFVPHRPDHTHVRLNPPLSGE
jgi:hypothetical protein